MAINRMVSEVRVWLEEAAQFIRESLDHTMTVVEKSGRTDLVTNIDEETQEFLMNKIRSHYPEDKILGEEKGYNTIDSLNGRVWIIDPIDGTMNFVMEQENFCIMLGIFENGIGQLGFIYDVMKNELYWGGKELGVYLNETRLTQPAFGKLSEGLLGLNAHMYGENTHFARVLGNKSMGVRISGCAGLEMIAMLKGNHNGYLSNLSPWDYAAGIVLLEEFGFKYSNLKGTPLSFDGREYFLAGSPETYEEILHYVLVNGE